MMKVITWLVEVTVGGVIAALVLFGYLHLLEGLGI